jgi:hypothetical protein
VKEASTVYKVCFEYLLEWTWLLWLVEFKWCSFI